MFLSLSPLLANILCREYQGASAYPFSLKCSRLNFGVGLWAEWPIDRTEDWLLVREVVFLHLILNLLGHELEQIRSGLARAVALDEEEDLHVGLGRHLLQHV